jgi:7-keto-8-aminopelargonate synthetase-like enzyme
MEDTPVPILCVPSRNGRTPAAICARLFSIGIAVDLARNYTSTPAGGALRVAICARHSREQIERLVNALAETAG